MTAVVKAATGAGEPPLPPVVPTASIVRVQE
jgi:hypothetical protein